MLRKREILQGVGNIARKVTPKGTKVWLYGSRARNNAREDSDWDLLILLNKPAIEKDDFRNISYPIIEFGWTCDADISPQLYTTKEWAEMQITPYAQNVEHDKMIVYESWINDKADYNVMFVAKKDDVLPNLQPAEDFIREVEALITNK